MMLCFQPCQTLKNENRKEIRDQNSKNKNEEEIQKDYELGIWNRTRKWNGEEEEGEGNDADDEGNSDVLLNYTCVRRK